MARGDNECIPYFEPASRITGHVSADVTGKRFVKVSQAIPGGIVGTENVQVAPCGAGQRAIGVAAYDEVAGAEVPLLNGPGMIVPVTAGEALTAGDLIVSDGTGKAVKYDAPALSGNAEDLPAIPVVLGQVVDDAANNTDAPVRLFT